MNKREQFDAAFKGQQLTPHEAKELEHRLKKEPENMMMRLALLGYYRQQEINTRSHSRKRLNAVLWMITNQPSYAAVIMDYVSLDNFPPDLWEIAKKKWVEQIAAHAEEPTVLFNAALFLIKRDFQLGHSLLKNLQSSDNKNALQYTSVLVTRGFEAMKYASGEEKVARAQIVTEEGSRALNLGLYNQADRRDFLTFLSEAWLELGNQDLAASYAEQASRIVVNEK
jgi:hypothetical protein